MSSSAGAREAQRRTKDQDAAKKVYDAEVVRRLLPYMKEWKLHAIGSVILMVITAENRGPEDAP